MEHKSNESPNGGRVEQHDSTLSIWSEHEIEEIQSETPWEIFSSQMDNWNDISGSASEF